MSENQPCGKRLFSNHDGCGKESGRQEVGPKHLVSFEKNGIAVVSGRSRPKKPQENGLGILWKKYRKVKNRRDIPTFFTGAVNARS